MRTSNPMLKDQTFRQGRTVADAAGAMTIQGAVNKTVILLFLALLTAGYTWGKFFESGMNVSVVMPFLWVGIIGGLIAAVVTAFKQQWAAITGPIYALLQGLFLGSISAFLEAQFPGIVIQAVGLTFGTMFVMLFLYKSRIIKVTEKFRMGVFAATGAIFLIYLVTMVLGFFGVNVPYIHEAGLFGIGFSVVVVIIAALNLVLDFDLIERGAEAGAPRYMEWFAAFALMVTLVWLYIEILRLIAKLRSGD